MFFRDEIFCLNKVKGYIFSISVFFKTSLKILIVSGYYEKIKANPTLKFFTIFWRVSVNSFYVSFKVLKKLSKSAILTSGFNCSFGMIFYKC